MLEYRVVDGQEYEVEVSYTLGGTGIFGGTIPRGYHLRIMPIARNGNFVSRTITVGEDKPDELRVFILEVKRKSKKKEEEAIKLAMPLIEEHFNRLESGEIPISRVS